MRWKLSVVTSVSILIILYLISTIILEFFFYPSLGTRPFLGTIGNFIKGIDLLISSLIFYCLFLYTNRNEISIKKNLIVLIISYIPLILLLHESTIDTTFFNNLYSGIGYFYPPLLPISKTIVTLSGLFFTILIIPLLFFKIYKNIIINNKFWVSQLILVLFLEVISIKVFAKLDYFTRLATRGISLLILIMSIIITFIAFIRHKSKSQ